MWAEDDGGDLRHAERGAGHAQVAVHRLLCSNSGGRNANMKDVGQARQADALPKRQGVQTA